LFAAIVWHRNSRLATGEQLASDSQESERAALPANRRVALGRRRHPYTRVLRVRNSACVPAMVQTRASAAEGGPADCLTMDPATFAVPAESCADVRVTLAATRLGALQAALHFSVRLEADWLALRACSSPRLDWRLHTYLARILPCPRHRAEYVSLAMWDQLFVFRCNRAAAAVLMSPRCPPLSLIYT
jgi:hypothetical protein